MGILKRFKDIMSANINAMLDKAEDPEKMIDQYLRDLQEDLSATHLAIREKYVSWSIRLLAIVLIPLL